MYAAAASYLVTVVHSSNSANADNNVDAMADYIMADPPELYAYMAYE